MMRAFREQVVRWAIRDSVPVLNLARGRDPVWPPLSTLAEYEPGSLGRLVADFLATRGLGFLPKYEAHDAIHALLGYDTDVRGELELQAFMWGNGSSSVAGRVLFLWGAAMLPEHIGPMGRALARGRRAPKLDVEHLAPRLRETAAEVPS